MIREDGKKGSGEIEGIVESSMVCFLLSQFFEMHGNGLTRLGNIPLHDSSTTSYTITCIYLNQISLTLPNVPSRQL